MNGVNVKEKLIQGVAFGFAFTISVYLTLKLIDLIKHQFTTSKIVIGKPISKFQVINSSHRLSASTDQHHHLVIVGEVKSDSFDTLSNVMLEVELRDANRGYVDSCDTSIELSKGTLIYPFKIRCFDVSELTHFEKYDFKLSGYSWN